VNSVNPTVALTKLGREAWSDLAKAEPLLARIPMGRFLGNVASKRAVFVSRHNMFTPLLLFVIFGIYFISVILEVSEIVDAIVYLLGDGASMVTGVNLPVEGGMCTS